MRALLALTGQAVDADIAAAAARVLDPARDEIIAVHIVHPREVEDTPDPSRVVDRNTAAPGGSIMPPPIADPPLAESTTQAMQRIAGEFDDHVQELGHRWLADFHISSAISVNRDAAEGILAIAREHQVGGLAMGTRANRSRFTSAVLGSCAEEVIRRGTVPVLVVKEGTVAGQ